MISCSKKICFLTSAHPFNDIRIFIKECKSLKNAGYEVILIAQHEKNTIVDGVNIIGINKPKNRRERMTKTVKHVYKKALDCNADIYHFHDPELIPVGLRLKKKGKKVIYDAHEDLPRQILSKPWIPSPLRKIISWFAERLENLSVRQFDYIITATPYICNRFVKINKHTIDVVNYPLLTELYKLNTDWETKEKYVCYIGGIGNDRCLQEIVEAIGKTDYNLLLAGNFESLTERQLAVNKNGWKQVIELGYVNREQVKEILSQSMAGLVLFYPEPNHINAQPNKMFEYMSAGIPVIASDFPLWKEIVEGNNCGMCVNPLNINEIANAINYLIHNTQLAEQMGKNGRKAVEEKYNWENEKTKLLGIYAELLD